MTKQVPVDLMAGPFFMAAAATTYNVAAVRWGRPTISTSIRRLCSTPLGIIVICATIGALLGHWLLDNTNK